MSCTSRPMTGRPVTWKRFPRDDGKVIPVSASAPTVAHRSAQTPAPRTTAPHPTAEAAVRAASVPFGKPPHVRHEYRDAGGEAVGLVLRWRLPTGGKAIRQASRRGDGWANGAMNAPRPLYRLPELLGSDPSGDPAEPVFLVEGEKAADALASVGLRVTTSPGGSSAWRKADWSPLAGRAATIWPDADEPGAKYAANVAGLLATLDPPATVRLLDPAGLWDGEDKMPAGWDAADFIDAHDATEPETLKARVLAAANTAPVGVTRNRRNAPDGGGFGDRPTGFVPFPLASLPEPVRSYVAAYAKVIGCEPGMVAGLLLASLASAVGNSRRLRLNNTYSEPAVVWVAGVCESGQRKSPALDAALAEVHRRQKTERRRYAEAFTAWEKEHAKWEAESAKWKRKPEGEPPDEPPEPTLRSYVVDDTTIEALRDVLDVNPRGVLSATEELAGWFGMLDRYASKGGGDGAKWLAMHGGRPVRIDRRTGPKKFTYIPRASVSLCGTVQPGTLKRLLTTDHLESGLVARWLFVWPPRRPLTWREGDVPTVVRDRLGSVVQALYELPMVPDRDGDPAPVEVPLTTDGKADYIRFFNANGAEMTNARGDEAASFSKAAAYAARFALIVHLVREAAGDPTLEHPAGRDGPGDPGATDAASVNAGVTMAEWFKGESSRVLAMLREAEGEAGRRELAEWVGAARDGAVTARDLAKARRHIYGGDSGKAERALRDLAKAGFGRFVPRPPGPRGGRPTEDFTLYGAGGAETLQPETPVRQAEQVVSGNADPAAVSNDAGDDDGEVGEWSA